MQENEINKTQNNAYWLTTSILKVRNIYIFEDTKVVLCFEEPSASLTESSC